MDKSVVKHLVKTKQMEIIDKAFEILKKVVPNLTPKALLETLQPIFEENKHLSREQIAIKMLQFIRQDQPFGDELSEAADSIMEDAPTVEESTRAVKEYPLDDNEQPKSSLTN